MSENTSIEWADHPFSPWEGCTRVGKARRHCYAEAGPEPALDDRSGQESLALTKHHPSRGTEGGS